MKDGPILVTGGAGFVGGWLIRTLRTAGREVVAADRPGTRAADVPLIEVDLRSREAVVAMIEAVRPGAVAHLAAVAFPRAAERDLASALDVNYLAVDHLVDALRRHAPRARLLFTSTGEVYGRRAPDAPPARETDPLRPTNTYAATKVAAERRLELAFREDGLDVIRSRAFNHSGPGRPADYVESSFARQIARLEAAPPPRVLEVGNLDSVRDWSDVRDVAAAYRVLLEDGRSGEAYNVCSGQVQPVAWVLETLRSLARGDVEVRVTPERYQAAAPDALALTGDASRLRSLGWSPIWRFEDTLAELLEFWRGADA